MGASFGIIHDRKIGWARKAVLSMTIILLPSPETTKRSLGDILIFNTCKVVTGKTDPEFKEKETAS